MPYLEVRGHQLHYTDQQPKNPPKKGPLTFIFIPGLGASENFFLPVLPHISDNHRCITFDTYGTSRSLFTGDVTSIESIAIDVLGILDTLHVEKAVVVGHSMGGIVANYLGAKHKNRVRGIVGIGPTHPTEAFGVNMKKRIDVVSKSGMEPIADTVPNQATGPNTTPLQKAFLREMFISQNPRGYAALCQAIVAAPFIDYKAITAPYLLIVGDQDKSATQENCDMIFDNIASSSKKMEILPGIGHWYCVEDDYAVGRMLWAFAGLLEAGD
ncbi:hypothetical protein MPDQ_006834 [Monascus purpureus]|uniref:AB hydrolase-1 domain-containing protein n=1 Tax=Monascus purpureus TaxID=5098 RepID=A0A507QTK9_MONPU|nr:hypothetical protein MPDQ_006834 [Monascus purpureus]